jgi:two-component system response regulator PilR (NtrC family)
VHVPPLRERREDIPVLAEHFLRRFGQAMGKPVSHISTEAMHRLTEYSWPGNVRELENVVERAVALETSPTVLPERLPAEMGRRAEGTELHDGFRLDDHLLAVEADLVRRALEQARGDRSETARLLGVSPRSLRYLLTKHRSLQD